MKQFERGFFAAIPFPFSRLNKFLGFLLIMAACSASAGTVWLDDLDLEKATQGWGQPQKNKSVDQHPLRVAGKQFERGFGTHAESVLYIDLNGAAERFTASVGVDDEINNNSEARIRFSVVGDGKVLWKSGVMKGGDSAKEVDVNLAGVKRLILKAEAGADGIGYDHADWGDARFEVDGPAPVAVNAPREPAEILTPAEGLNPSINGPRIVGARAGHPFLFTIPVSGPTPVRVEVSKLPPGLSFDADTARITGVLTQPGRYTISIKAKHSNLTDSKKLAIVCGDKIALTPPMGWNSWNCFANAVDDAKVRSAADAIVSSGLIRHGWTYINIDDCWEGKRDAEGRIQSNQKFPDMKALAEYVHSKGLKIGIYSSPGPKTCAGFEASYKHEQLDAEQYAAWGFDYLKYDWCSYEEVQDRSLPDRPRFMKPYEVMRKALDGVNRDIVFSLCQYGMGQVWQWGDHVGGNCWRTTGDIIDQWSSMAGIGFGQAGHEKFAGPGHWNDPDMLVVGRLGWGRLRPTRLTPNEQYTHISLWCLLDAPLLIGCDLSQLDPFTLNLLSNDEVLAVSQDALGQQAARLTQDGSLEVWAKTMEDGSKAVGLFNRGDETTPVQVSFATLGLTGKHRVRDLWRQRDIGAFTDSFAADVPRHGVVLVRIF